jgi:competence protein ComFC
LQKIKYDEKSEDVAGYFSTVNNLKVCFDDCLSVCLYEGLARELVHRLKYNDKREIAFTMAAMMHEAVLGEKVKFDYIVPVPISKKRMKKRGYNHAELIGRELSDITGVSIINTLERIKDTSSQVLLNVDERWYNVKGAFKHMNDLTDKYILLIDDVITTGATAHYCAEELKAAGAKKVTVVTFARTIK